LNHGNAAHPQDDDDVQLFWATPDHRRVQAAALALVDCLETQRGLTLVEGISSLALLECPEPAVWDMAAPHSPRPPAVTYWVNTQHRQEKMFSVAALSPQRALPALTR
jgi:hypothetical protein